MRAMLLQAIYANLNVSRKYKKMHHKDLQERWKNNIKEFLKTKYKRK